MVAQFKFEQLPPPRDDGRGFRIDHSYGRDKVFLYYRMAQAAATAMRHKRAVRWRVCFDPFASYGVNRIEETGELAWGSPLLALQIAYRYDLYIFCDRDPRATNDLAERIADPEILGLPVWEINLGSEALGREIQKVKGQNPETKVVVITGDSNEAPDVVRSLMPAWPGQRYVLSLLDPNDASFHWSALEKLTYQERMDILFLYPQEMDIGRNAVAYYLKQPPGTAKLDSYFRHPDDWRRIAEDPATRNLGSALCDMYKRDMETFMSYRYFGERDYRVRNSKNSPLYRLVFASKHEMGKKLWDSVNKDDPSGQILLPI